MFSKSIFIFCFSIITLCFTQTQEYVLKDGTKLKGTVLSESDTDLVVQTSFGAVTIKKSDLVLKEYKVKMLSGDVFKGTKQKDTDTDIHLLTNIGLLKLSKDNIASIEEIGKISTNGYVHKRRPRSLFGFLNNTSAGKNTDFSIGEEQLIDLFFDPTGYTLSQSTLYLSGLSFGFGVTDRFQISSKWASYFWGDMNIRPKFQVFKIGNWEKQQALSIGAHYHTRWMPNKYEWQSGSIEVPVYTGDQKWDEECPDEFDYYCWEQTAQKDYETKYWGRYYKMNEEINYSIRENEPNGYNENNLQFYDHEPTYYVDRDTDENFDFSAMIELFGAYTYSKARSGLKGRISHTIGGNFQYVNNDDPLMFYRIYYGLDVDITPKVKMISEIFYDPNYLEFWQLMEYDDHYCYGAECLNDEPVEKPTYNPIHLDFGFVYALNESFRFGVHFQQPFVAFYWKI